MKHVSSEDFWGLIERLDDAPRGARPVIEIDMEEGRTITEIKIGGRTLGEEVCCHKAHRISHYLTEEF